MFGMSFSEIVLIFIIVLLVFGPRQIPTIASQISKLIINIRHYFSEIKNDIYDKSGLSEIHDIKEDIRVIYSNVKHSINVDNKIQYHERFDYDTFEDLEIYFQPELDFDREPELFDELYLDEPRISKQSH